MKKIYLLTVLLLSGTALAGTSTSTTSTSLPSGMTISNGVVKNWSAVDKNSDARYSVQYGDTQWGSADQENTTWSNQAGASNFADSNKKIQSALKKKTGYSSITDAVKGTDEADKKCDEADDFINRYNTYRSELRESYAKKNGVDASSVTDEELDKLTPSETTALIDTIDHTGADSVDKYMNPDSYKDALKTKEEYEDKTWESVEKTIRDTVSQDEMLSSDKYTNGTDITEKFGISQNDLINEVPGTTLKTKDQAYEYYYDKVQADLDSNPTKYKEAVKTLQSYDPSLSSLDMNNEASRDYIASYVAAIASERQTLASGTSAESPL